MMEYRQAATFVDWAQGEGSGFLFLSVLENGEEGNLALTTAQTTANLQAHLRAAGMGDTRRTLSSTRAGLAVSHGINGTVKDLLMKYVEKKSAAVAD